MEFVLHPWHVLLLTVSAWINREQEQIIEYVLAAGAARRGVDDTLRQFTEETASESPAPGGGQGGWDMEPTWQCGYLGVRVGEARVPGHIRCGQLNVTSLSANEVIVAGMELDIMGLQEVRLPKAAQDSMARAMDRLLRL